jgi:putative phosphonate catabolism associated alcohol dehydrogenase
MSPLGTVARYARWDGAGRPFAVVEAQLPDVLAPGEVLVRIDLATVCGSDLHTVRGRRPSPAPGVLGHEQVGTVLAVGADAPAEPGQRVVWSVTASCWRCDRCTGGMPQKCRRLRKYGHEPLDDSAPFTGGFATHCVLLPGTTVVEVPDGVPDAVASPASCATATAAAALAAVPRDLDGRRVLVTGAGMLGVTAVAMAAERGAYVIAVDPDPARRARATRFGAAEVDENPPGGIDVAIELSGARDSVAACLSSVDVGGMVVLAGTVTPGEPVPIDPERIVRGLLTIVGVHNYRPVDLRTAVAFLAGHHDRYPFHELVAGAHPLSDMDSAFAAALEGDAARQAVVPG